MVIRLRERVTVQVTAEGATTPETLRQSGPQRWDQHAGKKLEFYRVSPKEQVFPLAKRKTRNLSGTETAGELDFARLAREVSAVV